jgi:UDP-GlcNAc:undecaprenyl-phosphate GlcNAc-1-phosphate transferase
MRLIEKRPVFQGGKDHSSHRLALLGLKRFGAVIVIYLISFSLGLTAYFVVRSQPSTGIILTGCVFFGMSLLGIRLAYVDTKTQGHRKI